MKTTPVGVVDKATDRDVLCPCCGYPHWHQFDDGEPATVATAPKRASDYGAWLTGFIPVRFYCGNCGFVRLHVVSPEALR